MNKHRFNFALPIISAIALPISSIAYSANPPSAIDILNDKLQKINTLQDELNKQLDESRARQIQIEQQRQLEIQNAELSGQVKALQQQVKELKQSELIEQQLQLETQNVKFSAQIQELQQKVEKFAQPSPWYKLLDVSGWNHNMYSLASCRVVNGWIEFRGVSIIGLAKGWPAAEALLLPVECRPQTVRYIEMPCHADSNHSPRNGVCNNDFHPDGMVKIHSDFPTAQQRWDGVRIWAGEN